MLAESIMEGHENCVGVHIRRGDFYWGEQVSPLNKFIEEMDGMVLEDPYIDFFVATDDKNVLECMLARYSDRCIYYTEKSWNRSSYEGQVSGLVELLCLSKTKKIYGTAGSSYCDEAANIGRIEKITICG